MKPIASLGGSDPNAFDAFKNERDYIAQNDRLITTVAAMDWATAEIDRLRADSAFLKELFAMADDRRYSSELIGIIVRNRRTVGPLGNQNER